MISTAIPDIILEQETVKMIAGMGYPLYFIVFIGYAKLIGSIAILVPQFNKIKEWAYAGLFFDLFGATYSMIAMQGVKIEMTFMLLPFSFLFYSYYLWNMKLKAL
jgi:hypothetical protein